MFNWSWLFIWSLQRYRIKLERSWLFICVMNYFKIYDYWQDWRNQFFSYSGNWGPDRAFIHQNVGSLSRGQACSFKHRHKVSFKGKKNKIKGIAIEFFNYLIILWQNNFYFKVCYASQLVRLLHLCDLWTLEGMACFQLDQHEDSV